MFCPKCKYEYEKGKTECPDCGEALVSELPKEQNEEYENLVTVLETGDPGMIALAKSLLEEASIPYFVKGEGLQDLFGLGGLGTGYNPLVGPAQVQVNESDAEEAKKLLEESNQNIIEDINEINEVNEEENVQENEELNCVNSSSFLGKVFVVFGILFAIGFVGFAVNFKLWDELMNSWQLFYNFAIAFTGLGGAAAVLLIGGLRHLRK